MTTQATQSAPAGEPTPNTATPGHPGHPGTPRTPGRPEASETSGTPSGPGAIGTLGCRIPLAKPYITEGVKRRVCEVLDSGWMTEGPVTAEFEKKFAEYVDAKHAIAVTSCTTGLEVALRAMEIGEGDEVIVPDYTYPATGSVVRIVGATPVIVDVRRDTMTIDWEAAERAVTPRTKAIMPVSIFGNPLNPETVRAFATKHNLRVIEDAACATGSSYDGAMVGSGVTPSGEASSEITVFSLHPRKTLACGEGGMITTNDDDLARWMRTYKNFGMDKSASAWVFQIPGTNYKISDVLSAIGLEMLGYLPDLLENRDQIAKQYFEKLAGVEGLTLPTIEPNGRHAWQSFPVYVGDRDGVKDALRDMGIATQIGTHALHTHPAFGPDFGAVVPETPEHSKYAFDHCLVLPMFHGMTEAQVDEVVAALRTVLR